ncbi:MAG: LysM peptidoglycan-binding domain-containing protein [Deltaproteobacteria bacterium]|nr:LysM peptidoglycan-binding domain-containing protein [Deltaproteobacteria bacterium]
MDKNREMETPEIMDDMSDELERTVRTERPFRRQKDQGMDPQKKAIIFGGTGAVILIVLLAVFFGGADKGASKEMNTVKARLDALEKRLAKSASSDQKVSGLESQIKGIQGSLAKLESSNRSLREHVDRTAQKMEDQIKKAAALPLPASGAKPQAQAEATRKKAPDGSQKILHEVMPKETLFGIAKKYNLTIGELRRMNNLSKTDTIQPGQKLLVKSSTQ